MSVGRILIAGAVLVAVAAGTTGWFITSRQPAASRVDLSYPEGVAAVVPLGFSAGKAPVLAASTTNPLAADRSAVEEGRKLFMQMNCAGCHGYGAGGGMGPNLTDTAWRYGGTPIEIYKSLYEGRPQGMPAWGNVLPPRTLWELVSYIQSLGGSFPAPSGGRQQASVISQGNGAQAGQNP